MSEELRNCPFCGGEAEVHGVHKRYDGTTIVAATYEIENNVHWVCCSNKPCPTTTRHLGSLDAVVAAWNRRPSPEAGWVSVEERLPGYPWRGLVYWEGYQDHSGVRWHRQGTNIGCHWTPGSSHADVNGWPNWVLRKLADDDAGTDFVEIKFWADIPLLLALPAGPEGEA